MLFLYHLKLPPVHGRCAFHTLATSTQWSLSSLSVLKHFPSPYCNVLDSPQGHPHKVCIYSSVTFFFEDLGESQRETFDIERRNLKSSLLGLSFELPKEAI